MIEFAKITGETEGSNIQVKMRTGECLYAPMVVVGNAATIPSESWIKDNKDSFLALVTYEKDMPISPMVIGFYPLEKYSSETNAVYKIVNLIQDIINILLKAKVLTLMGPQPLMPDAIKGLTGKLDTIKDILKDIENGRNN